MFKQKLMKPEDYSDKGSYKPSSQDPIESHSTLDSNPNAQLRRLEETIYNHFAIAKAQFSAIYSLVRNEVNHLKMMTRSGRNIDDYFLDSLYEIRAYCESITNNLPIGIQQTLFNPSVFHRYFGKRSAETALNNLNSRYKSPNKLRSLAIGSKNTLIDSNSLLAPPNSTKILKMSNKAHSKNLSFLTGHWQQLEEVHLDENNLCNIPSLMSLEAPQLRTLNLQQNIIPSFQPLRGVYFPSLTLLNLSSNKFKSLNGFAETNLPNLASLNLSNNFLQSLQQLEDCSFPSLVELNIASNRLGSLSSLEDCAFPIIEILNADYNDLTSLNELTECSFPKLRVLSFGNNRVTSLKFLESAQLHRLSALIGNHNQINRLQALTKARLPELTSIILHNNLLEDASCLLQTRFSKLKELDLENNKFKHDEMGCFSRPQKSIKELRKLYPFLLI